MKVLLAPLDPVHDNAIKLLNRKLAEAGYETATMPPGSTPEEVIEAGLRLHPSAILVSRTLGYQVGEILGRLVDLAEASGLRESTRLGIGGMAITKEIGAEIGFDGTFVGELDMPEVLAFLEGREFKAQAAGIRQAPRLKPNLVEGYTYQFKDDRIQSLLDSITDQILVWVKGKTSPGIERANIRAEMLAEGVASKSFAGNPLSRQRLLDRYVALCGADIAAFYREGKLPAGVRHLRPDEIENLPDILKNGGMVSGGIRHAAQTTSFFTQYGTGCPVMDVMHIKTCEAWGIDGVIHFDPSWGASSEGLLEGLLSHEHDGTIVTEENFHFIQQYIDPGTAWLVRVHRGLNTPETLVLGQACGADYLKINIPYGSTGGGTDPERLTVDGVYCMQKAAQYGLPFNIPGNDELSGVPPHKTFAGLLIMTALGLKLGAKPIPNPLLCFSPYMMVHGYMDDNMVDMNLAKLAIWREIIDAPVWPGEPVGFMTHTPDRVQSSVATAAHAALAASAGVVAVTIASSDEAYSKGPISVPARVDTIRASREMLRFLGSSQFHLSHTAESMITQLHEGITDVLEKVAKRGDFVAAIYEGLLGDQSDGLYPGRSGRHTVVSDAADLEKVLSPDTHWH
jgi:methylmalonyl-CoA mutase cobalamin-binding subunit